MDRNVASVRSLLRRSSIVWNIGVSSLLFVGFLAIATLGDTHAAGKATQHVSGGSSKELPGLTVHATLICCVTHHPMEFCIVHNAFSHRHVCDGLAGRRSLALAESKTQSAQASQPGECTSKFVIELQLRASAMQMIFLFLTPTFDDVMMNSSSNITKAAGGHERGSEK
jgi:hypothetical protein